MANTYREVTSQTGLGGNIKRRFGGMIVGILLFLGAFPLLWWNEGQLKQQHEGLDWLTETTASVDPREAGSGTEGQPVHLVGMAETSEALTDSLFSLSLNGLLRLNRQVEMYQWKETETTRTEDTAGGGSRTITEYSYSKVWSEEAINSSGFARGGYDNPSMPYQSQWFNARAATLGVFELQDNVITRLDDTAVLPITTYPIEPPIGFIAANETQLFRGEGSLNDPLIGDIRTQFNYVSNQTISVLARQSGTRLAQINTPNNLNYLLVDQGDHTAVQLIEAKRSEEELKAWIFRGVGLLMMLIGVQSIFHFIGSLFGFIPFVRGFVGGIGFLAGFLVALTLGSLTIATAWLAARPSFAIALFGLAAITFIGGTVFGRRNVRKTRDKLANA
ncbi:MAG: TMEM43 family protein [Pseudomonadota bacterium]